MGTPAGSPKTRHHRETERFKAVSARLAARVRRLRQERGWTLEQAAEQMKVEPAHVRRIEGGTANPSLAVITSVAAAFDLDVAELLAGES